MSEVHHEAGRQGVERVKRLLEGTTRFKFQYTAYNNAERTTLGLLSTGTTKCFDLGGDFLNDDGTEAVPVYVESKNVDQPGSQTTQFKEFLAHAYSATAARRDETGIEPNFEFMWATTCPWKATDFRKVSTREALVEAIGDADESIIPSDHQIDDALITAVAGRLWVWVISERQEDMVLGQKMRGVVAMNMVGE